MQEDDIAFGGEEGTFNIFNLKSKTVTYTTKIHGARVKNMSIVPSDDDQGDFSRKIHRNFDENSF
jgi:hypothetical protein